MRSVQLPIDSFRQLRGKVALPGAVLLLALSMASCGGGTTGTQTGTSTPANKPQAYFAPNVAGSTYSVGIGISPALTSPLTYTLDDTALTFTQTTYLPQTQPGPQVLNAGDITMGQRGLRILGVTANYVYEDSSSAAKYVPVAPASQAGSYAVELANQAGGLIQLVGQPAAPMVAATACPNSGSSQTYLFITIPGGLTTSAIGSLDAWDPTTDTAYGVVQINSSGSSVTLQNIQQFTLPSMGGTGKPTQPGPLSATGACASSFFGDTTVVPGQVVITDPNTNGTGVPPQATLAIGPTGLLVEDSGSNASGKLPSTSPALTYNNVLGAGTGAVGLPQPSGALSTKALTGAQYLGFIYGAGQYIGHNPPTENWSSNIASFGFPSSVQPSCPQVSAVAPIYGGDFPINPVTGLRDPTSSNSNNPNYPYGNCDFVIDLGTETTAGLYPDATVWVGAGYGANTSVATTYSFQAVAIAGQLQDGKYSIFLIGEDSTQPWAIYLLQSI